MKSRFMAGLLAGLALGAAPFSAQAEPGKEVGKQGPAMQVMIDRKSGRKIITDDSERAAPVVSSSAASGITPMADYPERSYAIGKTAAGVEAAVVGTEHHKYLVMSIDENGKRHVDHKSQAQIEAGEFEVSNERGDH